MNRRSFLTTSAALVAGASYASAQEAILSRVKAPTFPNRDFDITKYGGAGDGTKDCTDAIRKAIAACSKAGGGNVIVSNGVFLTGAVHLDNNVNLHISEGATLKFSPDPKQYMPVVLTRWEGTEGMNFSPLIYCFGKSNIAVTGTGTLDGGADAQHWWDWKRGHDEDRNMLLAYNEKSTPVKDRIFGLGHYLRPYFIQPYRSNNVLIEGVKIINSPMWEINPVLCRNVTVRGVNIDTHGPNNDGVDPDSCTDMLIENCSFSTGDDCIAIKSGRDADGRRVGVPTSNLLIRNCDMRDGHGGVSVGSEVSGGINNVVVENCRMSSPNLERALRIKTNSYRGGTIENITFKDVTVGEVKEAVIEIDYFYEKGEGGPFKPIVRNVNVSNVTSKKSKYGLYLHGYANDPIQGLTVTNCHFENAAKGDYKVNVAS